MSAVIARHPTDNTWVSFERRGGGYDPYRVEVGGLRQVIANSLTGATGVWSFSERSADAVLGCVAHEMADLKMPELANVATTVMMPATEGNADIWVTAHALRGDLSYGERWHKSELLQRALKWFQEVGGFENLDASRRPTWARDLLLRPNWFQTPAAVASEKEKARMAHLAEVQARYEGAKKAKDPIERSRRLKEQMAADNRVLSLNNWITKTERAIAEHENLPPHMQSPQTLEQLKADLATYRRQLEEVKQTIKARVGLLPIVKITPTPPRPLAGVEGPEGLKFYPGYGWFVGNEPQGGQ
jgi:hypothetical protein